MGRHVSRYCPAVGALEKMDDFSFEGLTVDGFGELESLYRLAFDQRFEIEEFTRKHNSGVQVGDLLAVVGRIGGEVVSYYGVYPCVAVVKGEKIVIAQSGDTMTSPRHSGKGLFIRGANEVYRRAVASGVKAVFGIPSQASFHGFKKLGWRFPYRFKRYRVFVPTIPVSFFLCRFSTFWRCYLKLARCLLRVMEDDSIFFPSSSYSRGNYIYRDPRYWASKIGRKNVFTIRVFGVKCVFKIFGSRLVVGDIETKTGVVNKRVLGVLYFISFLLGVSFIEFYMSPGHPYARQLEKIISSKEALPYGYIDFNENEVLDDLLLTSFDFDTF